MYIYCFTESVHLQLSPPPAYEHDFLLCTALSQLGKFPKTIHTRKENMAAEQLKTGEMPYVTDSFKYYEMLGQARQLKAKCSP